MKEDTESKATVLCLDELNEAYKRCRIEAETMNCERYMVVMGRDPLVMGNLSRILGNSGELDIVLKLRFEFDYTLGRKGSWYLISDVDVIDLED